MAESNNPEKPTTGEEANQFSATFTYDQEISNILRDLDIDPKEVCLSGSVSFAVRGIRDNNDIDIITDGETLDASELPEFCDITNDAFEMIGLSDDQILENDEYHDIICRFKIIRPELVFSYKKFHERPKDKRDLKLLQEYAFNNPDDWNWELVTYRGERRFSSSPSGSLLRKVLSSLRRHGLRTTAAQGYEQYFESRVQDLRERLNFLYLTYSLWGEITIQMPVDELLARQHQFVPFEESKILTEYIMFRELYEQESSESSREAFVEDIAESAGISIDTQNISVPISRRGRVTDPTHFAAALFLGIQEIKVEIQKGRPDPVLARWADEEKLSGQLSRDEARLEILRRYGLLFYAILWPAVDDCFNEIEKVIAEKNETTILRSEEIAFDTDSGFAEFIWKIYEPAANPDWSTKKKIHKLRNQSNMVRLLEIEFNDAVIEDDVQDVVSSLKNEIRDEYRHNLEKYFHDIIIHMGDSYEENRYILNVLRQLEEAHIGYYKDYEGRGTIADSVDKYD
jgi:hypothetical protein